MVISITLNTNSHDILKEHLSTIQILGDSLIVSFFPYLSTTNINITLDRDLNFFIRKNHTISRSNVVHSLANVTIFKMRKEIELDIKRAS